MEDNIHSDLTQYNLLEKKLEDFYSNCARIFGLSDSVFWILYSVLDHREPYTQTELCNMWSFNRRTINTALKNLESDGIIRLEPVKKSPKNKLIFLTDRGTELAQRTVIPFMEVEKKAFGAFEEEERKEFLRLMQKHVDLLQEEFNNELLQKKQEVNSCQE